MFVPRSPSDEDITSEDLLAAWKAASDKEREEFVAAICKQMGKEEFYLMLIDIAGGEEELEQLIAEHMHQSNLS